MVDEMAATCSPYRPGGLATQTATTDPASPGLNPDFAVSRSFEHEFPEVRDGLPSIEQDPEFRDELPSIAVGPDCRDGLPRSGDVEGYVHTEAKFMNSSSDSADTAFLRVFHDDEKSEGVRQSDSRVQNLPASVSSSELSAHQMSGSLAGNVRITSIEPSGLDPEGSDGCSLFGLTSVPSVSLLIGGTSVAVESAEDIPSEQREASKKRSIETTAVVDDVPSESLSISDRALLRRFGQVKTVQRNTGCVEGSRSEDSASGLSVDGHPLKLSMNIFDRALLRRFPDIPPTLSAFSSTKQDEDSSLSCSAAVVPSPPGGDSKETTRKRKRFIRKGSTKKANICPEPRDNFLQKQEQSDTPCGFMPEDAVSIVPSTSLSSPSVPGTVPSDFALLYCTLVKDNASPLGYLQQFLNLEIPARRAAKRSQISAASISDSMASTALSELRTKS